MLYEDNDHEFVAAVARALGESMHLVRSRGFIRDAADALQDEDTVDFAAIGIVDWDSYDDSRLHTCRRSRRRPAA
jgi:hypothetical protein